MWVEREHRLELAEVRDPRVLGALAHVDGMSDEDLRVLAHSEHPMVVEASEAIIARRRAIARRAS
jgi:hypothetical protein